MCVGYFLVLLAVTIVNVALPQIGSRLHTAVSALQWVVDAYALALASLMLAGGTIGDLRGHKRIVLIGLAVCGLGPAGLRAGPECRRPGRGTRGARGRRGAAAALFLIPEKRSAAR